MCSVSYREKVLHIISVCVAHITENRTLLYLVFIVQGANCFEHQLKCVTLYSTYLPHPPNPTPLYVLSALLIPLTMCAHCTVNTHCVLNQCSWLLPRVCRVTHLQCTSESVFNQCICSEFNQVWCSNSVVYSTR